MTTPALVPMCWCGSTLTPTRVRTATFALLRCPSCGTFKIDPPPIHHDAESGDFYTAYYASKRAPTAPADAGAGRASRYWHVVRKVPSLSTPARTVIDFGSGDGQLCSELAASGWADVVGLDASRERVARARHRYPRLRFYDRPVDETDLLPGAADLCVMDNVIEHLVEPARVLRQLGRYLRPGGRLVVITPNMESGHFRFLGRRWTPELAPHAHVFLFTAASLRRALVQAGFEVETVGTFQDDPYPLGALVRRLGAGDVKGALWRAHQELGAWYARLTGAGPMLFAVSRVPAERGVAQATSDRPAPASYEAVS